MNNAKDVDIQNASDETQSKNDLFLRYIKEIFVISIAFCGFAAFIVAFTQEETGDAQFLIFVTAMIFATYYALTENFFDENQRREVIRDTVWAIVVFAVFLVAGALDLIPESELDENTKKAILLIVGIVGAAFSGVIICLGIVVFFKLGWKYLLEPQLLRRTR